MDDDVKGSIGGDSLGIGPIHSGNALAGNNVSVCRKNAVTAFNSYFSGINSYWEAMLQD